MIALRVTESDGATMKRCAVSANGLTVTVDLWKKSVIDTGSCGVSWGAYGGVPIEDAEAFYAALGKAIEIARHYEKELGS